jgi:hypothetical protein
VDMIWYWAWGIFNGSLCVEWFLSYTLDRRVY